MWTFGHADHNATQADVVRNALHTASDANEKSPLHGRDSAAHVRSDGRGSTFTLATEKARESDVVATELAEDAHVRVALPGGRGCS